MSVTSIRLQPDLEDGLDALSEKLQRSRNWVINEAIREYVAKRSLDETRWAETRVSIEAVAAGAVVSGEAVSAWVASWGKSDESTAPKRGE